MPSTGGGFDGSAAAGRSQRDGRVWQRFDLESTCTTGTLRGNGGNLRQRSVPRTSASISPGHPQVPFQGICERIEDV
jgi:hypothetical protein